MASKFLSLSEYFKWLSMDAVSNVVMIVLALLCAYVLFVLFVFAYPAVFSKDRG